MQPSVDEDHGNLLTPPFPQRRIGVDGYVDQLNLIGATVGEISEHLVDDAAGHLAQVAPVAADESEGHHAPILDLPQIARSRGTPKRGPAAPTLEA